FSDPATLLPSRSCRDCITTTSVYDFRKGQAAGHLRGGRPPKRRGPFPPGHLSSGRSTLPAGQAPAIRNQQDHELRFGLEAPGFRAVIATADRKARWSLVDQNGDVRCV